MSAAASPIIAVVLPPREGFGPRRARGIGLTVRHHALATSTEHTVVFGSRQFGPVFPDVTFRLAHTVAFIPGRVQARYALGLLFALRRLRPASIEVHAEPLVAMWLQRLFPAIPVVLFLHDVPEANRLTRTPELRSELLSRTARIVTLSAWLRDRFLEGVRPHAHAPIVIPPCVDLTGLSTSEAASATRRTPLVLFAGRLIPEKGVEQFVSACITALPRLPGWRAEIIGADQHAVTSPETQFVRLIRAIAEPASISMMGYRDHPDLMAAMASAAIVVIPSRTPEAGGRLALEAMASGAAVICPREGAFPEIVGDAAVYADPAQPTELAAAICALGGDPRRLATLGEAGRKRAARFDLSKIGAQLDEARARIIADGAPRR
ncbi:MAG: glycosyltransferase [Acetobacteraceae bacterium]|nr:glycosyltransferase [Acetobacteraceae bacterium]